VLSQFLLAILALWVATPDIQAQPDGRWRRQPSGTLAWLQSVFFLNQDKGWIVGSRGTLMSTSDGGKTWQTQPRPTNDLLRDIYFTDELNGWLVCERNIYELKTKDDPRTFLMQTTDGGQHWERVNLTGKDADLRLVRAVFSRSGRGWAFGETGAVFVLRSAKAEWVRLNSPTRNVLLGGTFIDDHRGWIVGAGATILQTSDGGETWHLSRLASANNVRFTATSFVDNRLGWAVGQAGTIFRTLNGGRTWQQLSSGVSADLYDVKFLDANEGWAAGAEGTVVHTRDGGLTWTVEPTGTEHQLERLSFSSRTNGWAVGFGGTIVSFSRDPAK
jgi:photosystem II stability/assembly factor-like uncharacterized protein